MAPPPGQAPCLRDTHANGRRVDGVSSVFFIASGLPQIRSPATLWRLLHTGPFTPTLSWGDLCGVRVLTDLVGPLRALRRSAHPPLFSWNLRHMRDSHTSNNQQKCHTIFQGSARSRAAFLQETHWTEVDANMWTSLLQGRQVLAAPAVPSPDGGRGLSAGVAIVLSEEYAEPRATVLVEGCVLMVDTRWRNAPIRFVVVYFPPATREATIRALRANPPPADGIPTYWGGTSTASGRIRARGRPTTLPRGLESSHSGTRHRYLWMGLRELPSKESRK